MPELSIEFFLFLVKIMIDFYKYSDYFDYYSKWSFFNYCVDRLSLINESSFSCYKVNLHQLHCWLSLLSFYNNNPHDDYDIYFCCSRIVKYRKLCLLDCHLFSQFLFFQHSIESFTADDFKVFKIIDKKSTECPRLFCFLAKKIKSRSKTISCIRKRLNYIVSRDTNSYFVTFTFNDLCFAKLDKVTRRRYISRICKQFSSSYVANLDYGGQFGREHYHALMNCSDIDNLKRVYHDYFYDSIINVKKVTNSPKSLTNLCSYTNKLVLHCVKSSADRIIYSR